MDENKEEITQGSSDSAVTFNKEDKAYVESVVDMVKEMETTIKNIETSISDCLANTYGVKFDIINKAIALDKDSIDSLTDDEMKNIISEYVTDETIAPSDREGRIDLLKFAKDAAITFFKAKVDCDDIKGNVKNMIDTYIESLSRAGLNGSMDKTLADLADRYKNETDPDKKAAIGKEFDTAKDAISLSLLINRFTKYGKKEVENAVDSFFKHDKASYIMNKYKTNVTKFGFNSDIFKFFFNIEENFLPEEYHCYNNFFLYLSMRAIAFADSYRKEDKLFVTSLITHLSDLVYHRFKSLEDEKIFIGFICSIEDTFTDYEEVFKESNTSYKENPVRKEEEKKIYDIKLNRIRKKLQDALIKYSDDASYDELAKQYDDFIKDTVNKETANEEENNTSEITPEDLAESSVEE